MSVDRSLLAIFAAEQSEHIARIRALLGEVSTVSAAKHPAIIEELLRRLHTLKGAARAVGLERTEVVIHEAEERLTTLQRETGELELRERTELIKMLEIAEDVLAANFADPAEQAPVSAPGPGGGTVQDDGQNLVRVNIRRVDDFIRDSSELLANANRDASEIRSADLASSAFDLFREWQDLRSSVLSIDGVRHSPEAKSIAAQFSGFEARFGTFQRQLDAMVEISQVHGNLLRDSASRLYDDACRIRMTPAEVVLGSFGPMMRDLAAQENKEVVFQVEGLETNADRLVLQSLKDPVMHLLRNALSHGIERASEREKTGKAGAGTIRLHIATRGDRMVISVEDDGRGLDYGAIEQLARERGVIPAEQSVGSSQEIARFLLLPGVSTATSVSGISGRGMGMSVVQRAVSQFHGDVDIKDRPGGGTQVVLSVPLTIATQQVLLVSVKGQTFGFPASSVESLYRVRASEIRMVHGRNCIVTTNGPVPLSRLDQVLGLPGGTEVVNNEDMIACAILRKNERRVAIIADRLLDSREVIIRDTGLPAEHVGLATGGIPMEDGTVAVVLNVSGIFALADNSKSVAAPNLGSHAPPPKTILVVDDSLTTRTLEKSILEAHGFRVQLAVDGLEALERVRSAAPDLVISDVMMPRMTGFQLLERIKMDDSLKHIPVILVTSLESREEQQHGLTLGADAYIVKKRFDQRELLDVIKQIL